MSINIVILRGNLVKQPEIEQSPSGKPYCKFTLAVPRDYKNKDGIYESDFIRCVSWNTYSSEFLCKYFNKGDGVIVEGKLKVDTYDDQQGERKWVTQVLVSKIDFGGSKSASKKQPEQTEQPMVQPFRRPLPDISIEVAEDDLPF